MRTTIIWFPYFSPHPSRFTQSSLPPPPHLVPRCLARLQASRECPTWGRAGPPRGVAWRGFMGNVAHVPLSAPPRLMCSKRLQTQTPIHSAMRRPPSDGPRRKKAGEDKLGGFKGIHCNFNEIAFPLQVSDCDESIRTCFASFLWDIYFQKETVNSDAIRGHMRKTACGTVKSPLVL